MAIREQSILSARAYENGMAVVEIPLDQAGEWAAKPGHFVWIGLREPQEAELATLQAQLGLDPLAIEDAGQPHERPKMQRYGDGVFIVVRTAELIDDRVTFGETHIFAGRGYIVTIRHGASVAYSRVRAHCEATPSQLAKGVAFVVHTLLDFTVDHYLRVMDSLEAEGDAIEAQVLAKELPPEQTRRLYVLRRELLRMKIGILPLAEICGRLEHSEVLEIDPRLEHCFREVTDHVRGAQEEIDSLSARLGLAFEASLLTSQAQQTEISRRLAAWAAILAVPTAMAGIYGMNFAEMPELQWKYGYPMVLSVVVVTCLILFVNFRRAKWL
ncbi:MAG: magnesium and cobalt transport protein CorA [Polymorphobacter sp.]